MLSCPASAAGSEKNDKPVAEESDGFEAVQLAVGDPAPFAGTLIGPELRDELFTTADESAERVRAAALRESKKGELLLEFEKQRYGFLEDARKADAEAFQRQLERLSPHWTERPAFVIPVTVVGVLAVFAIVAAVLAGSDRIYSEISAQ